MRISFCFWKRCYHAVGDNVSSVVAQIFGTIVMIVLAGVDDNFWENDDTIVGDGVGEIFPQLLVMGW